MNGVRDIIDESFNSDATTSALAELIKEPINNSISVGSSMDSYRVEKPLTNAGTDEIRK